MDSYQEAFVRIQNISGASNPINILKGAKPGCLLSSLLFGININPIFSHIKREGNHIYTYSTNEFSIKYIQAYADYVILISKSIKGLQSLVDDVDIFFTFLNIKLKSKKCKTFKIRSKKNEEIITIGGERKEFIQDIDFIKYLGVPLSSKRIDKKKFIGAEMQKFFYRLNKLGFLGLAINQVLRTIRRFLYHN
jgi:hypothetical protein